MTLLVGLLIAALAAAEPAHQLVVASASSSRLAITVKPDILTADDGVTILTVDGTEIPLEAK